MSILQIYPIIMKPHGFVKKIIFIEHTYYIVIDVGHLFCYCIVLTNYNISICLLKILISYTQLDVEGEHTFATKGHYAPIKFHLKCYKPQ